MKKICFALVVLVGLFSLQSCTKYIEVPAEPEKKYSPRDHAEHTDTPPRGLWAAGQVYAQTYQLYISEYEVDSALFLGYACNNIYDPNTGVFITSEDCGEWYEVPVYKYWGTYEGKIYVSASYTYIAMTGALLNAARRIVKDKGVTDGDLCDSYYDHCRNPYGYKKRATWVRQ